MWNATSPYSPTHQTGLIRLLPGLLVTLSENLDLLLVCLSLLDSYILLGAADLIQVRLLCQRVLTEQNHGTAICDALMTALNTSQGNAGGVRRILITVCLLVRATPLQELAPLLLDTGVLNHILAALEDDKASGVILAAYLDILARIAMIDPAAFLFLLAGQAKRGSKDPAKQLEEALDAVWRNFDYVGEPRMRKAAAMGMGALLTTGDPHVLDRLDGEFSECMPNRLDSQLRRFSEYLPGRTW